MAVWVDVTDQANWTAQRIVFADPTPLTCLPSSGYSEDGTDVYTWDTDHWVLPSLTSTTNSGFARVPTLRYIGPITSGEVQGIRVTGNIVGDHTIPIAGTNCEHFAIAFDPEPFIDHTVAPYFIDDCGVVGADISSSSTIADGTQYVLEITGDPGAFLQFMNNITFVAMCDNADFCGPYFVQDDVPSSFGGNITKIEFLAGSLSLFWTDFVGCQELI